MRYIFWTIGAALLITAAVLIGHPAALYDYEGYAEMPIDTALQLQAEFGNQEWTLDAATNTAYMHYHFADTRQGDYGLTGTLRYYPSGWLIICAVFGVFSAGLGFIYWDEGRAFLKRCLPGKKKCGTR
jgi:hypothetical protein